MPSLWRWKVEVWLVPIIAHTSYILLIWKTNTMGLTPRSAASSSYILTTPGPKCSSLWMPGACADETWETFPSQCPATGCCVWSRCPLGSIFLVTSLLTYFVFLYPGVLSKWDLALKIPLILSWCEVKTSLWWHLPLLHCQSPCLIQTLNTLLPLSLPNCTVPFLIRLLIVDFATGS